LGTRPRILDSAEARFAATGFTATSLGDIAADVGIRTPSLYRHFSSKQALYEEVLARLLDPWVALMAEILEPANVDDAVGNLQRALEHYLATPNLARLVQHAALAGGEELELVLRWYEPLLRRGTELSSAAPNPGGLEPALVLVAFHGMLSGYVTLAPLHATALGHDPLGTAATARYRAMLAGMTRALWAV